MKASHSPIRLLLRTALVCILLLFFLLTAGIGSLIGYTASLFKDDPVPSRADLTKQLDQLSQTSHVTYGDGTLVGHLRADAERKVVQLQEVSPFLLQALVATEDHEFYHHPGISLRGILRAMRDNLLAHQSISGGSTITQQLVKNSVLQNREKVLGRKLKEIVHALHLEQTLTKKEILTAYVNSLYFGKGAHGRNMLGVQAASRGIFGVDVKSLTLPQAAYLAGMVQRPTAFDPFQPQSREAGTRRMKTVLQRMQKKGMIPPSTYQQALAAEVTPVPVKTKKTNAYQRQPFLMAAVEEETAKILMKADGLNSEELSKQGRYRATLEQYRKRVLTGGYTIETTIDRAVFTALNRAVATAPFFAPPLSYTVQGQRVTNAQEEVGAVLLDVNTGGMLAFVGGRDFAQSQTNHALHARRQPGSIIKPLLDYAPALEHGLLMPGSVLIDEPLTSFGQQGTKKVYKNHNDTYYGPVTAREALRLSLNIPAIRLFRELGEKRAFAYLKAMDLPIHPRDSEASAIGGFTRGFTVANMTAGYAMLARDGLWQPPHLIKRITDAQGTLIYEHPREAKRIFSSTTAFLTLDLLREVVQSGTGRWIGARAKGHHLAGKTGTTQRGQDLWFVGTTPQLALGVWVGYDHTHPLSDDQRAKQVWNRLFHTALSTKPSLSPPHTSFLSAATVEKTDICTVSGKRATDACRLTGEVRADWVYKEESEQGERIDSCPLHKQADIVRVGKREYLADPRTPREFVHQQAGIFASEAVPLTSWYRGKILPETFDPRPSESSPPAPIVHQDLLADGVRLSWLPAETRVVGYRVYRGGEPIASLPVDSLTQWTGPPGNYTVTAVDLRGQESEPGTPQASSTNE